MTDITKLDDLFRPSAKTAFPKDTPPGTTITGTIDTVHVRPVTKYGTTEPDYWADGSPKQQVVIIVQTSLVEDENDDGKRAHYVKSWGQAKNEILQAVRAAGETKPGTKISITYLGKEEISSPKGTFNQKKFSYQLAKGADPALENALDQNTRNGASAAVQAAQLAATQTQTAGTTENDNGQLQQKIHSLQAAGLDPTTIQAALGIDQATYMQALTPPF